MRTPPPPFSINSPYRSQVHRGLSKPPPQNQQQRGRDKEKETRQRGDNAALLEKSCVFK